MESLILTANGIAFHALADGPEDGPLVLCLHGFPELGRSWRHQLPALAGRRLPGGRTRPAWLRPDGAPRAVRPRDARRRRCRARRGTRPRAGDRRRPRLGRRGRLERRRAPALAGREARGAQLPTTAGSRPGDAALAVPAAAVVVHPLLPAPVAPGAAHGRELRRGRGPSARRRLVSTGRLGRATSWLPTASRSRGPGGQRRRSTGTGRRSDARSDPAARAGCRLSRRRRSSSGESRTASSGASSLRPTACAARSPRATADGGPDRGRRALRPERGAATRERRDSPLARAGDMRASSPSRSPPPGSREHRSPCRGAKWRLRRTSDGSSSSAGSSRPVRARGASTPTIPPAARVDAPARTSRSPSTTRRRPRRVDGSSSSAVTAPTGGRCAPRSCSTARAGAPCPGLPRSERPPPRRRPRTGASGSSGAGRATGSRATMLALDLRTLRWRVARGPRPREHLAATALGGKVYAVGGRLAGYDTNLATVEAFDPRTNRWIACPTSRRREAGQVRRRSQVASSPSAASRHRERSEPSGRFGCSTGRWSRLADLPTPRHGLGVVALGGRVWAVAGGPEPGLTVSGAVESLPSVGRRQAR